MAGAAGTFDIKWGAVDAERKQQGGRKILDPVTALTAPFERLVHTIAEETLDSQISDRGTVGAVMVRKCVRETLTRLFTLTDDTADAEEVQHETCDFRSGGRCVILV